MKKLILMTSVLPVLAVLASPFANAQDCKSTPRKPQEIRIDLDANGEPQFVDKHCGGNGKPGDICNAAGDLPRMVFKLRGGASDWKLVRMELSNEGRLWGAHPIPEGAKRDFRFSNHANERRAWPDVTLNGNATQMEVENDNCNEFTLHYRIILEDPEGEVYKLHPVIQNKGRR